MVDRRQSEVVTLERIQAGTSCWVRNIRLEGLLRRRLLDLGFIPGAEIVPTLISPLGDPRGYRLHETIIALRQEEAACVTVTTARPAPGEPPALIDRPPAADLLPLRREDDFSFTVALAGNPNAGKSTLFNALTGLRQHVGNWPGKTVARCEGTLLLGHRRFTVVDLPGTYSLLSSSPEEEIARDFLLFGAPDCTILVLDSTSLQRQMNLAFQVMEITDRVVVCLNLADEASRKGITIDVERLEQSLGIPVVRCVARSGEGLDRLCAMMAAVGTGAIRPRPLRIPLAEHLHEAVAELVPLIEDIFPGLPNARWIALRLLDGGDQRLRQEIRTGVLADLAGRIGDQSVGGLPPVLPEIPR
ncbi:MAG: iron transporter FeoB [Candidatus Riflebacteria bacterium]|nr:iron transporter FeoB [Candidatus Riflebacteria bacterium]